MARARITDQCLWLAHIDDPTFKAALGSIHPEGVISLIVDGVCIDFRRMATGRDGRHTEGFVPIGKNAAEWKARYVPGEHREIEIEFAGTVDA